VCKLCTPTFFSLFIFFFYFCCLVRNISKIVFWDSVKKQKAHAITLYDMCFNKSRPQQKAHKNFLLVSGWTTLVGICKFHIDTCSLLYFPVYMLPEGIWTEWNWLDLTWIKQCPYMPGITVYTVWARDIMKSTEWHRDVLQNFLLLLRLLSESNITATRTSLTVQ
jgi:hypothetical protein